MQTLFDVPSFRLLAAIWTGIALLGAFVIWTIVRTPGRRQDPGLPHNRRARPPSAR